MAENKRLRVAEGSRREAEKAAMLEITDENNHLKAAAATTAAAVAADIAATVAALQAAEAKTDATQAVAAELRGSLKQEKEAGRKAGARTAEAGRKQLESTLGAAESGRKAAEAGRKAAEAGRKSAEERIVGLQAEAARFADEARRLKGQLAAAAAVRGEGVGPEQRSAGAAAREMLLDEREAGLAARDAECRELAAQTAEKRLENARLDEQLRQQQKDMAEASYLEAHSSPAPGAAASGGDASGSSSRADSAWRQKRMQEAFALRRKVADMEAAADRHAADLQQAQADAREHKAKLEAEVTASKKRNSSAWRLRQENDDLRKERDTAQEKLGAVQAVGAGDSHEAAVAVADAAAALQALATQREVAELAAASAAEWRRQAEQMSATLTMREHSATTELAQERAAHKQTSRQRDVHARQVRRNASIPLSFLAFPHSKAQAFFWQAENLAKELVAEQRKQAAAKPTKRAKSPAHGTSPPTSSNPKRRTRRDKQPRGKPHGHNYRPLPPPVCVWCMVSSGNCWVSQALPSRSSSPPSRRPSSRRPLWWRSTRSSSRPKRPATRRRLW